MTFITFVINCDCTCDLYYICALNTHPLESISTPNRKCSCVMCPLHSVVIIHLLHACLCVSTLKNVLCTTATEAEIDGGAHDSFVVARNLAAPVLWTVAPVVVERPHYLSILIALSLSSVDRNLSVAVGIRTLGTNL